MGHSHNAAFELAICIVGKQYNTVYLLSKEMIDVWTLLTNFIKVDDCNAIIGMTERLFHVPNWVVINRDLSTGSRSKRTEL